MRDTAPRALQAGRATPPIPAGRMGCCATPARNTSPSRRPASKATWSGCVASAMNEVGGPFPDIPYRQPQAKPLTIPIPTGGSSRSREKKFTGCDLLHREPLPPGSKNRNGPKNPSNAARRQRGHPRRLRFDHRRHRGGRFCADLSHPHLTNLGGLRPTLK
jgi:hypothetical protein